MNLLYLWCTCVLKGINTQVQTGLEVNSQQVYNRFFFSTGYTGVDHDNRRSRHPSPRAQVLAILDAWDKASNPHDPKWRQQYAQAAIAAGLPCVDDVTGRDLGPVGWRAWTGVT